MFNFDASPFIEKLQAELANANIKLLELENKILDLTREKDDALRSSEELSFHLENCREKIKELNKEVSQHKDENSGLRDEISSLKLKLDSPAKGPLVKYEVDSKDQNTASHPVRDMPTEEVIPTGEEVQTEGERPIEVGHSEQSFSQLFDAYKQDNQESASIGEIEIEEIEVKGDFEESFKIKIEVEEDDHAVLDVETPFKEKVRRKRLKRKKGNIMEEDPTTTPGQLFSCFLCDFSATTNKECRQHKQVVHGCGNNRFPCAECAFVGKSKSALIVHRDAIHRGIKVSCEECDKQFNRSSALYKHVRAEHRRIPYDCELCSFTCFRSTILKEHVDAKHRGIKYFCDQCPFSTSMKASLWNHNIRAHGPGALLGPRRRFKDKPTIPKNHQCDQCGYTTSIVAILREHIEVQHQGKVYRCDQCAYFTKYRVALKAHIDGLHRKIRHKCQLCDVTFSSLSNLRKHEMRADKKQTASKHTCDICGLVSCLALKKHKRLAHPNVDKLVPCDECDKSFNTTSYLKLHKKTKHCMERVRCDECAEDFASNQNLERHKKSFHA